MKSDLINILDLLLDKKRASILHKCDLMNKDGIRWNLVENENGYCKGLDEAIELIKGLLMDHKYTNDDIEDVKE